VPIAVLVVIGTSAPVLKTISVLREWPLWSRQPLVAACAALAATMVMLRRHPRAMKIEAAQPGSGRHAERVVLAGLGLLPMRPPSWTIQRSARLAMAVAAAALAVVASAQLHRSLRIGMLCSALLLFGLLVELDRRRQQAWRRAPATAPPERILLWAVTPLFLAGAATAVVLAVRGSAGGLTSSRLAELTLVTALGEELIFRGALLAIAYRAVSPLIAELSTAASFGLWHLGDALGDSRGDDGLARTAAVVGTVLFTAAGGLLFSWMRHRTGSLLGSWFTHVATNLPGTALI
jgi:membrane protease YdiL (CAAX protease family)